MATRKKRFDDLAEMRAAWTEVTMTEAAQARGLHYDDIDVGMRATWDFWKRTDRRSQRRISVRYYRFRVCPVTITEIVRAKNGNVVRITVHVEDQTWVSQRFKDGPRFTPRASRLGAFVLEGWHRETGNRLLCGDWPVPS